MSTMRKAIIAGLAALAIAAGQYQGAMFDACGQVAPLLPRSAVGFQVFQGPCVFFAQAHGFCQPECVQRSHALSCCVCEPGA